MRLFDANALPGTSWKNGGGITRTLLAWPSAADFDNFDWRVSIADIATSGGFSRFPGVDRTIMLLSGAGMVLHINDREEVTLDVPFEPYSFSGDDHVDSRLLNGSARDLNVMTRRGRAQATVNVWKTEFRIQNASNGALFFCARGGYRMESFDAEGSCAMDAGWALHVDEVPADIYGAPETPDAVMIAIQVDLVSKGNQESRGENS